MVTGLVWVLVAALALGLGSLAQGVAAVRHTGPLSGLLVRPLFVLGLAADGVGFAAHVLALRTVPMAVAQGSVSASLAVTALGARLLLGARFRAVETAAVATVCVGLGLLAALSGSTGTVADAAPLVVALAAATLVLALTGGAALLAAPSWRGGLLGVVSGLAFAVCSLGVRLLDTTQPLSALTDPVLPVLVAAATVGGLSWAAALRHAPVTAVTAIVVATEVIPPSLLGPLLLGDAVGTAFVVVAPLVLAATAVAGTVLARVAQDGNGRTGRTPGIDRHPSRVSTAA